MRILPTLALALLTLAVPGLAQTAQTAPPEAGQTAPQKAKAKAKHHKKHRARRSAHRKSSHTPTTGQQAAKPQA